MRARGSSAELLLAATLALVAAACFRPEVDRCKISCEDLACPLGLECAADGYCHRPGDPTDPPTCAAPDDDAAVPDDGAPIDAALPPDAALPSRVTDLAAGSHHACVVDADTRLVCWGDNRRAQLGIGTAPARTGMPQIVGAETSWSAVDAGWNHTCGINNGELFCWGNNDSGQCGGSGSTVIAPTQPSGSGSGWLAIAAGGVHSCGIREAVAGERRLYCWGSDSRGQLGDGAGVTGNAALREVAMSSDGAVHTDWEDVTAGYDHTCARRAGGEAYCWGSNDHGQVGDDSELDRFVPTRVAASSPSALTRYWRIDAGANATCALGQVDDASDGELYCWGDNSGNLLGLPGVPEADVPTQLAGDNWTFFGVGTYATCAAPLAGGVQCWGNGNTGALGDGTWRIATSPTPTALTSGQFDVVAGTDFACAASHAGGVWCWGANPHGEPGDGTIATKYAPTLIDDAGAWTWVSTGETHSCGIRDGELYCWGWNESAQLGVAGAEALEPTHVDIGAAGGTWREVEVGHRTSCAIEQDGGDRRLWCWGTDTDGQTGQGMTGPRSPVTIGPASAAWHGLSHGGNAVCALDGDQRWCWGLALGYGLGNGDDALAVTVPTSIDGPWIAVTMGNQFGCALAASGAVSCWGLDHRGQQGDGAAISTHPTPTAIASLTTATALAAAFRGDHAVATDGGQLRGWGRNDYEQLGHSSGDADVTSPTQGGAGRTFEQLSAGTRHTVGIDDGRLYCMGDNSGAQCGNEALGFSVATPTQIGTATDWQRIDAGLEHTCGIRGGALYCWGNNVHGQLGDGTGARPVPVPASLPDTVN